MVVFYGTTMTPFVVDFSLLNIGEFLNREMNLYEIINHLLCKWSTKRLPALEKKTSNVIISSGPKPH